MYDCISIYKMYTVYTCISFTIGLIITRFGKFSLLFAYRHRKMIGNIILISTQIDKLLLECEVSNGCKILKFFKD